MAIKGILSGLFSRSDTPSLPNSFLFGVATADHQCEAFDAKYRDIRDLWEEEHFPKAARGRATDFWNRYSEDIEKARDLRCNAFRFSLAWSRIEPRPSRYSEEALKHYEDLIMKIISCNMVPVLTLHHFTWPIHVQERGGMIADGFPQMYADYVSRVAERFGNTVPYWITFNEPNLLMRGYIKPWWDEHYLAPPGMPAGASTSEEVEAVGKLVRNLFLSHKRAYEIIKAKNPQALIGANQYFYGLPLWLQRLVDRNASAIKGDRDLKKQVDRLALKRDLVRGERISKFRASILEKERVDIVLAALSKTEEREMQVAFSEDYFIAYPKIMAKSEGDRESYAAAVARGDRNLLEVVNSVIRDLDQSAIMMRWRAEYERATGVRIENSERDSPATAKGYRRAGREIPASNPVSVPKAPTGTVLRRIQDRGYLIAAVREDLPGFGYRNPDTGKLEGLEIILAQALAERILGDPKKLRLVPVAVPNSIEMVEQRSGPIDWIVRQYTILSTVLLANWWYMGMAGELSDYLCPPGCEGKMDFVGLDYYWGIPSLRIDRLQRLLDASYKRFDRAPVWPEGLYNTLQDLHRKFPGYPLIICENGSVTVADGWKRARYISEHIKQVQKALKDGIDVDGYICWSITSNREWDLEFNDASDFGLYHIDLDKETDPPLIRHRTAAADKYEEIIKSMKA